MKQGRTLPAVLMELQRQNAAKQDFIGPAQSFKLVIMPGRPQLSSIVSKTHAPAQTMMNASMQTFMGFRFPVITLYLE